MDNIDWMKVEQKAGKQKESTAGEDSDGSSTDDEPEPVNKLSIWKGNNPSHSCMYEKYTFMIELDCI